MKDLLKDTLYVGLGAALLTKDKVEETLRALVEEGKISQLEAKQTAEKILEKGQDDLKKFLEQFQGAVSGKMQFLDLASKTEQQELTRRLQDVEKRLQAMDIRLAAMEDMQIAPETPKDNA